MNSPKLPTPRSLLTTLLTSLSSTTTNQPTNNALPQMLHQQAINSPYDQPRDPPTNPLKSLPASHRAILTTLHVVLPTGVLLQALDLLDRGLVVRAVEQLPPCNAENEKQQDERRVMPPQAHVHLSEAEPSTQVQGQDQVLGNNTSNAHEQNAVGNEGAATQQHPPRHPKKLKGNQIYQVRSSQAPKSRFRDTSSGSGIGGSLVYMVRLEAWNCSCAAFAFESFPGSTYPQAQKPWLDLDDSDSDEREDGNIEEEDEMEAGKGVEWEFGGLSFDGKAGRNGREARKVPICKHLLACLLAERWDGVLGGYVRERGVGREEMAGLNGEG